MSTPFKIAVIVLLSFILMQTTVISMNTTPKSEAELTTYPDWVDQTKQKCPDGLHFVKDCVMIPMTHDERYEQFKEQCVYSYYATGTSYIKPECVEAIIDDRLAPINEKLDYIIYSNGFNCDFAFGNFNGTKCFETWKNKQ